MQGTSTTRGVQEASLPTPLSICASQEGSTLRSHTLTRLSTKNARRTPTPSAPLSVECSTSLLMTRMRLSRLLPPLALWPLPSRYASPVTPSKAFIQPGSAASWQTADQTVQLREAETDGQTQGPRNLNGCDLQPSACVYSQQPVHAFRWLHSAATVNSCHRLAATAPPPALLPLPLSLSVSVSVSLSLSVSVSLCLSVSLSLSLSLSGSLSLYLSVFSLLPQSLLLRSFSCLSPSLSPSLPLSLSLSLSSVSE